MELNVNDETVSKESAKSSETLVLSEQNISLSRLLGKRLSDAAIFPNEEKWKKRLRRIKNKDELLEKVLEAQSASKIKTLWKRLWKTKNPTQQQILAASPFMLKLIEKISEPTFIWDPSLIRLFISCDMLSSRVSSRLIDVILEHEDLDLLTYYFKHVRDISEKDVVKCLNKLIPLENSSLSPELDTFVRNLMKLPYTETTLMEEFRHLQFERALVLISYLSTVLKTEDLMAYSNFIQAFSWTSLLLDAHFTQTIISSEAWQIIVDLQETVAVQMELYKDLTDLHVTWNKIQNMIAATKLKADANKNFLYKIEIMTI